MFRRPLNYPHTYTPMQDIYKGNITLWQLDKPFLEVNQVKAARITDKTVWLPVQTRDGIRHDRRARDGGTYTYYQSEWEALKALQERIDRRIRGEEKKLEDFKKRKTQCAARLDQLREQYNG